jgi:hypothetical protein
MSVLLEISDGNPWWLSPNIWTVPGNDPEGPAGLPIVGQPAYLWAKVTNNGTNGVTDATVRFYWANPAVGFDRNTANLIGISNVSLNPGETQDVLCLVPWIPVFVNNGHECILAEAFHQSSDPLPPTPVFNVPTDRHVAQRNLSVVMAAKKMFSLAFEVHNKERVKRSFTIEAVQGKLGQIEPLIPYLGRDFKLPKKEGRVKDLGFVRKPCPNTDDWKKAEHGVIKLTLEPNERMGWTLVGTLEDGAAVVHVIQKNDDRDVGGLSILILSQEGKQTGGETQ